MEDNSDLSFLTFDLSSIMLSTLILRKYAVEDMTSDSLNSPVNLSPEILTPSSSQSPNPTPLLNVKKDHDSDDQLVPPLLVYSRRKKNPELVASQPLDPVQDQSAMTGNNPISLPPEFCFPIALRKGTRKCTQHPIANFMSFTNLSTSHKAFLIELHAIKNPKTAQEALSSKEWKNAMIEEMRALEKK